MRDKILEMIREYNSGCPVTADYVLDAIETLLLDEDKLLREFCQEANMDLHKAICKELNDHEDYVDNGDASNRNFAEEMYLLLIKAKEYTKGATL